MNRREFIGAVPLLLAGCGSGYSEDGDMAQEYTIQPSPMRTGSNLTDSPVPGYQSLLWKPKPTFGGGQTGMSVAASGHYVLIGSLVVAWFHVLFSARGTSTGEVLIEDLPFAPQGSHQDGINSDGGFISPCKWINLANTFVSVHAALYQTGVPSFRFLGVSAAATSNSTPLVETDVANNSQLAGVFIYSR